jgi:hypothetical protein
MFLGLGFRVQGLGLGPVSLDAAPEALKCPASLVHAKRKVIARVCLGSLMTFTQ